jgi:FKBP-type peptidyl-prolyl cis-trans isomerase
MKAHEKGICAFYSELGYGYSGSGSAIPRFAPIVFEIEIVDYKE